MKAVEIDIGNYMRFVLALVFVLALIALMTVVARKLGFGHNTTMMSGKERRLGVVEIMPLDARRKLVLVRRDDKEHLLMLGPSSETVVERGIDRGARSDDEPRKSKDASFLKAASADWAVDS